MSELEAEVLNGLLWPFSKPASASTDGEGCVAVCSWHTVDVDIEIFGQKVGVDAKLVDPMLVTT